MNDSIAPNTDDAAPGRALTVTETKAADRKTIIVNGREHAYDGDEIGRGELARLAFPTIGVAGDSALTVAYDNGPEGARHGLLGSGRTTRVLDGQAFSVSLCDKS
jgi:hypothetical protein